MPTAPSADARFRAVFDAHHREVHAFCLRRLGTHDANEAAADALFAAWRRIDDEPAEATRGWLFGLARHAVELRERRPGQVRVLARDGAADPVAADPGTVQTVRHPSYDAIHDAMAGLREIDREVVLLGLWEGLASDEIARALGITERSVARRHRRVLAKLAGRHTRTGGATGPAAVARRIAAADPVPVTESLPFAASSAGGLLAMVDSRYVPTGPLAPLQIERSSGGWSGLVLSTLVASTGVLLVIFLVVSVVGPPERRTPPTTTPPPTVIVTTTHMPDLPVDPLALPADTPALEVVETMYERWSRADIDGYRALVDETTAGYNLPSFDHAAWYRLLSGVVDVRTCDSLDDGVVNCTTRYFSGLAHGQELFREQADFIVERGRIVTIEPREQLGLFNVGFDRDGLVGYRNWVLDNEPDRFDELFAFGTSILLHTPDLREAHQALMGRYRSDTEPSGALPGAMPIKVVDTYFGHLRVGDLDGALELISSMSQETLQLVPTEREVRYFDVTQMAIGRICDTLSTIQVQCDVTYYSGLRPGTELTGHLLVYTVVEGRIVAIDAIGPVEDVVIADEPALARYRAWLAADDPSEKVELFGSDGTILLDTEAARAAHRGHITRYLGISEG